MSIIILSMLDLFQSLKTVVLTPLNHCVSNVDELTMLNTHVLFSSPTFGYYVTSNIAWCRINTDVYI